MDERIARLAQLFSTLQQCTDRLIAEDVEFDEDAYKLAVNLIGRTLVDLGTRQFANERFVTDHWIAEGATKCDLLLRTMRRQRRNVVTVEDVRTLMAKAPAPTNPDFVTME
jgi:hypothetical protein